MTRVAFMAVLLALAGCDSVDWTATAERWVWAACGANEDLTCDDPPAPPRAGDVTP